MVNGSMCDKGSRRRTKEGTYIARKKRNTGTGWGRGGLENWRKIWGTVKRK